MCRVGRTLLKMMVLSKSGVTLSSVFLYLGKRSKKCGRPLIKESELEKGSFVCLGSPLLGMVPLPTVVLLVDCQILLLKSRILSRDTQGQRVLRLSHPWCCPAQLRISEPPFSFQQNGVHIPHWVVWGFSEIWEPMKALAPSSRSMKDSYCALRLVVLGTILSSLKEGKATVNPFHLGSKYSIIYGTWEEHPTTQMPN